MKSVRLVATTIAITMITAVMTTTSASAGTLGPTGWTAPSTKDNGIHVTIKIREYSGNVTALDRYRLDFDSYGETLKLWDGLSDGTEAVARVWVYNKSGTLVDTDTFTTGTRDSYNLGTPDGSGNIPEGYDIRFQLSGGGVTSGYWWGRA